MFNSESVKLHEKRHFLWNVYELIFNQSIKRKKINGAFVPSYRKNYFFASCKL